MPFCTQCGSTLDASDRFCRECGGEVRAAAPAPSARPPAAVPSSTAPVPSRPDPPIDDRPSAGDTDSSRAARPASAAPQRLLSFSSADEKSFAPRFLFILCFALLVIFTGWAGYRWFSRPAPDGTAASVDSTEQSLEASNGLLNPPPAGALDRPGPESATEASAHSDAPREAELWNVIVEFTKETTDAANALGAPDGRLAVIAPGGSVALARPDGPFYNGDGPDVQAHGPREQRVSYTIFAKSGPDDAWVQFDLNRRGFADGTASHDFGHHEIQRAQRIMVRNDGTSLLYLDAVTALALEPDSHDDDESPSHQQTR